MLNSRDIKEWNRIPKADKAAAVSVPKPPAKGSLKKAKTCKKTKGCHELEWKSLPYPWEDGTEPTVTQELVCKLCGKKTDWRVWCRTCLRPLRRGEWIGPLHRKPHEKQ